MYPWYESLSAWNERTHLKIDALGLVTILGADAINRNVGRLVSGPFDFLPLFGAFVIAGNSFAEKQSGFILYNISSGIMTTELAAWFSRWLRAQEMHQVRSIVTWKQTDGTKTWTGFLVGVFLLGIPLNGMLVALTVLSEDWWGFANATSMIVSIIVRYVLISQNRTGIDNDVRKAKIDADKFMKKGGGYDKEMAAYEKRLQEYEAANRKFGRIEGIISSAEMPPSERKPIPPQNQFQTSKVLVIRDDSKVVTIETPEYLVRLFAVNPRVPYPRVYTIFQWIGWIAFAVHIVSIGMSALPAQIYTVLLLSISTMLNVSKVGCDDSLLWKKFKHWCGGKGVARDPCLVSSTLEASLTVYDREFCFWKTDGTVAARDAAAAMVREEEEVKWWWSRRRRGRTDAEASIRRALEARERRQDVYAWLDLNKAEDETIRAWNLTPRNDQWWDTYLAKKKEHSERAIIKVKRMAAREMEARKDVREEVGKEFSVVDVSLF